MGERAAGTALAPERGREPAGPAWPELEPGVCRQQVADALSLARQLSGLTQQQAAAALDWSQSKMVRAEAATSPTRVSDLRAALDLYQVRDPGQVQRLTDLARAARRPPWHSQHRVRIPGQGLYLETERSATALCGYRIRAVPGLLQTPAYAHAMWMACGRGRVREHLALLAARQALLSSADCPVLIYVLDEAVLHRQVGGPAVMTAQLARLAQAAEHPQITVRVVPFTVPVPPAGDHTTFSLPDGTSSTWHETATGGLAPCDLARIPHHREHITRLIDLSVPMSTS